MNYPTHDLELVGVVFAMKIWRRFLYGVHEDMFIDNKNLLYVLTQRQFCCRLFQSHVHGQLSHVEDEKKEVICDVHRLAQFGVRLVDSAKGGFMVQHRS